MQGLRFRTVLLTGLAISAFSCENDGTGPDGQLRDVQVAFATTRSAAGSAQSQARMMLDDTLTAGADTIILTRVALVLREIELKRTETEDCESEKCEEFEAGPVLIELPLDGSVDVRFGVNLPPGSYSELEFDIHKIDGDDSEDAAFAQQHPEFIGKSVRVEGTFNGIAFVYESELDVEQELNLSPPLVVDDTTDSTAITIVVDVDGWFRSGNTLVDPATANKDGPNENLVRDNIRDSLEAFEDEDLDGKR